MGLTIFYEGIDSSQGYQSSVLRELDKKVQFDKCILTSKNADGTDQYEPSKYRVLDYDMCAHARYDKYYDLNELDALSEETITAMSEYEVIAMQLLGREYNFDVFTLGECKRLYLLHLRFWNHLFNHEHVNFIVLADNPHHTHDYIIYGLGKTRNINMFIWPGCTMPLRRFYCNDIESIGKKMMERYVELSGVEEFQLPEDVKAFYGRNLLKNRVDISKDSNGNSKKKHAKASKRHHFKDIDYVFQLKKRIKRSLVMHKNTMITGDTEALRYYKNETKEQWKYIRRCHRLLKEMKTLRYYNSIAEAPVEGEDFILFLLQYQPEASTLPAAGVYVEQELALMNLSKSLEGTGIRLYVKEHFVQPCRPAHYYDDIKNIHGVRLIKSGFDSKELTKKSMASATCTGTIILESIINGKPVFVFGHNGFEEGPGIYKVRSTKDCVDALKHMQKHTIEQTDVLRFLQAFADTTFISMQYCDHLQGMDEKKIENSKIAFVEKLVKSIREYDTIF